MPLSYGLNASVRLCGLLLRTRPSCSMYFRNDILSTTRRPLNYLNSRFCSSSSPNDNNDDKTNKDLDEEQPSPDLEANELTLFTDSSPMQFKVPENLPDVPIIAINRYPFFPGFIKKVDLKQNEALMNLIKSKARQKLPYVGLFVKKNPDDKSEAVPSISHLYTVGTFAHIFEMRDHEGRMLEMILNSHRRIRILQPLEPSIDFPKGNGRRKLSGNRKANLKTKKEEMQAEEQPVEQQIDQPPEEKLIIYARTENIVDNVPTQISIEITVKMQAIVSIVREIIRDNNMMAQHVALLLQPEHSIVDNPVYLCDFVGTIAQNAETEELQAVMEEINIMRRLDLALELLEKERARVKMLKNIRESVEKKVQEQNHKYLLNEQLKAIKRELGIEKEDKQAVLERLDERLANLNVPEYAMKVIKEEQTKLSFLDPHSSEFSISRNYLDWLTSIPWGKTSEEVTDVNRAQKILEEDHYGMKDIKERILEFIAVGILKKQTNGKILCFYGPPGVGKTSIAKSIARALNREYYRFSVGGMTDVAEIKGHRRTYIGAMPGKIIQCFKKVQAENPLILIDEIDKIGGAGYHGDPASALLEVLDPEQNSNFLDHFIDVPVDLSKVLFICTANETDRIPGPVKDRMEMIEVSGYVAEEKIEIAKNFLVPKCREKCALTEENLIITNEAINTLIRSYCRESGVRNLEKHLEKIFRKAAFRIVSKEENKNEKIIVDNSNLKEFVGREKFTSERLYDVTPPGVIMGLAWTAMGGSALYIEASLARKLRPWDAHQIVNTNVTTNSPSPPQPQGSLEATGHLGDVMKESMRTAYTVAKNVLGRRDPNNEFLEQAHIHVHVPEGAVPKDGPSAGCTITSALLSLATGKPAVQGISMTGEISLTGKVLPVGGIKEKIIAAKRAGVNCVVLPEENKKDYEDLADFIKKDVEIHFVDHYDQVFDLIFPDFVPTTDSS
uniref:Lon protease homolog, mitochondrial n=2 Tax=Meloidogyne incognita TaxID=6306 RepID=A0A914LLP4_MELIC